MDARNALAKGIAALRRDRGWTQALLAERANLSIQFVAALEQGAKSPRPEKLDALAFAFGVKTSEIFAAGEESPAKPIQASKALLRVAAAVPAGHEQHAIEMLQVLNRAVSMPTKRPGSRATSTRTSRRRG